MESAKRGKSTSRAEVTNVSEHGFWMLVDKRELFVAFDHFPWFRNANVITLFHVERPSAGHLHWPSLDIDLAVDSIEYPEKYPLVSHVRERPPRRRRTRSRQER